MRPRIAIPEPSCDPKYVLRALPEYEQAVSAAGGEPVRIPLDQKPAAVMKLISRCDGVLLPSSRADVIREMAPYVIRTRHLLTTSATPWTNSCFRTLST